jgi:hypothetical protein
MNSTIDDFKTGDFVIHSNLGPGRVTSHETIGHFGGRVVIVEYDRKTAKEPLRGEYDRRWFEMLPNVLSRLSPPE